MRVECNQCRAQFDVADTLAGSHVNCAQCGQVVQAVPIAGAVGEQGGPPGPPPRPKVGVTGEGSTLSRVINGLLSFVAAIALLVGAGFFVSDGRILALVRGETALATLDGVVVRSMHSVNFETGAGEQLLVVFGEVENRSSKGRKALYAVADLVNGKGEVVASGRAPIGAVLEAEDLYALTDDASLQAAFVAKMTGDNGWLLKAAGTSSYTVVIRNAPADPQALRHRVNLEKGEPMAAPPPPAEPPAESAEGTGTAGEDPSTAADAEGEKGKRKGRKGKRKKKRGKTKIKG